MNTRYPGWAAFVLLGVACSAPPSFVGPADASTDSGPSNMTACSNLATAQCTKLESCSSAIMQIKYGSVATCEARMVEICLNSLVAPATGNNAVTTGACAQAYASWACPDYFNNVNEPSACAQPTGGLANGKACAFPAQCVTGYCAVPPNAACGVCAPAPTPGDSCANLASCSSQGLICLSASKVCGMYGAPGASCSAAAPCGASLSCIGAEEGKGIPGKCEASVALIGAHCDPKLVTGPGCDYDANLVCNSKTRQCETISVSPEGGPCNSENNQYAPCSASGRCSTSEAGATGTCVAAVADGMACSTTVSGQCLTPARCVVTASGSTSGTCQVPTSATCK